MSLKSKFLFITTFILLTFFIFLFKFGPENLSFQKKPSRNIAGDNFLRQKLDNGLQILVKENHRTPLVTIYALVGVGSANEDKFTGAGISHFVEHMLFKGTQKHTLGQVHKLVKSWGGDINGFTSLDYTGYYITIPKDKFNESLELMADILENSSFVEDEFLKEREVILKEIAMNQDLPKRAVLRNLWQEAYLMHPYQHPVIGYKELFLKLKRDDLVNFYKENYTPDNIIISIVGDIKKQEALKESEKILSKFKMGFIKKPDSNTIEPLQQTERLFIENSRIQLAHLALGFKSVNINSEDLYALDLLGYVLSEGESSRLKSKLKNELKIVYGIEAYNYTPKDNGLFIITAVFGGQDFNKILDTIKDELKKIKTRSISSKELKKAKNMILSNALNHLKTTKTEADDLASSLILTGNANFTGKYIDKINSVTKEEIKKAANFYLTDDRLTVSVLLPEDNISKKPLPKERIKHEDNGIKKIILPNDMTLLLKEEHTYPLISIQAVFKGGLRFEDKDNNGLCNLMTQLLLEGTSKRTAIEIDEELALRGASINAYSYNNSFGLRVNLMNKDLKFCLNMLNDIINKPAFEEEKIEHQKEIILASIKQQKDNIFSKGFLTIKENFFKNHPYAFSPLGTQDSISNIKREDILNFYGKLVIPSNMILSIAGDIDTKEAEKLVKESLCSFKQENTKKPEIRLPYENFKPGINIISEKTDKKQVLVMIAFSSPVVVGRDRYAFEVLDVIFSGGGSRLFYNLRDQKKLAYSVGTLLMSGFEPGTYIFYIATSEDLTEEATDGLLDEIKKIKELGVTQEEINEAKAYLLGKHYMNLQTNEKVALKCALDEMYGLGYNNHLKYKDKINRVSLDEIEAVIEKYLDLNNYTLVTLKPR